MDQQEPFVRLARPSLCQRPACRRVGIQGRSLVFDPNVGWIPMNDLGRRLPGWWRR